MDKMIRTAEQIIPTIYAYTTPDIPKHDGWTKIGDTKRGAETRIEEQTFTADIDYKLEWELTAKYEASDETFRDHDFHAYMQKKGVERKQRKNANGQLVDLEWFKIVPGEAKMMLYDFRADRGIIRRLGAVPYSLRDEQLDAVEKTKEYFTSYEGKAPEFLWNAKPRFGKTLTAYDLCMALGAEKILIVTNRPALADSWYNDYEKFFGPESGYYFVSSADTLRNKRGVVSHEQLVSLIMAGTDLKGWIEFVSLQDLKGSIYFGGQYDKLKHLYKGDKLLNIAPGYTWDVLIIDEAHEGVDTYKTDVAFNKIARRYTLHLSGTPFKALANDKFESRAIYNWTYADEQKAKRDWSDEDRSNPYTELPRLNLLTYRMSDIVFDRVSEGADFNDDGDNEAYAFDLNEFFETNASGGFVHDRDVDMFLDALTTKKKFPFSEEYRGELKHTLWVLKYVASAKALYKKLKDHPVFGEYELVLAAGDGKVTDDENVLDDEEMDTTVRRSLDKVRKAVREHERTITLSVGQLTTGITVPEWTAVMMLSNMKSPALYMQAAFRAQNPWQYTQSGKTYRKENAYVFDFDPARTLDIFEQFANGLYSDTSGGKGDTDVRKRHVRELLNFFPVYGEDEEGEMIELDAEKVLSIPRAIHAKEVVRRGFMSNFLFQNISGIFAAPAVVTSIINKLEPVKEPAPVNNKTSEELSLNEEGEVEIPQETVIGTANNIFGQKLYADIASELASAVSTVSDEREKYDDRKDDTLEKLKEAMHIKLTDELTETAKENYGKNMTRSTQADVTRKINKKTDKEVEKHYGEFAIQQNIIEEERKKAVEIAQSEGRQEDIAAINNEAMEKHRANSRQFEENIMGAIHDIIQDAGNRIVQAVETDRKEKEKKTVEDKVRDHLRGFSRTIPSFLMGYGDDETTLQNFDKVVPSEVFLEVTGITVEDFVFLRDGGEYPDPDNENSMKHFDGRLFDEVVFNDSVREFLRKRDQLADYFREDAKEDIFNYIPPPRTNQIYTPKKVVQQMADLLEQEDPGCFDNPDHTFIDPYMKSGLYITEIVKRLFRSPRMVELYPDETQRLKHIFDKQVYGLAPTEIIYAIATHYILGFAKLRGLEISSKHFKMLDALPYAQGTMDMSLAEKLDEIFVE
ncbi:MAG: DEAD/DEAH box helicase family protein [Lachnospiraceae bacterium]|nr:DEAD/DEAH box helicase family protein [Lachnospiraceae bacterium]